ncbi:MAG: NAD(P)-dependent oxidoreductase [Steroidobacteraceae bacterium]
MRCLVTGANGFLGGATVAAIAARGGTTITTDIEGSVDHRGDLADIAFCNSLPAVDCVVHCAAVQYIRRDIPLITRSAWFHRNNVLATKNLCDRYADARTHFVYVGTSMMYQAMNGEDLLPTAALAGQGVYSDSKLAGLRRVQQLPRWSCMVPCIIGGRGREGLFRGFVNSIRRAGIAIVPGPCRHATHMVHVEDAANLLALIALGNHQGIFNAAAPTPLSILQWIDEIASELGASRVTRLHIPLPLVSAIAVTSRYRLLAREQLQMLRHRHVLNTDASLALGWKPLRSNAQIAREIARYICDG